jgi:hypothetical protein
MLAPKQGSYCFLLFPPASPRIYSHSPRLKLKVLVPGAGLGRLAYDVAKMGMVQPHPLLFSSV